MISQSRSLSHQCTGPRNSCSDGHCTRSLSATTTTTTSASSHNSGPTNAAADFGGKSPCLTASSSASASAIATPQITDFTHTRGEVDKEGIRYPSSDLSSSSRSHSNSYLEANPDTERDKDISASNYTVSDSEPGLALAPVSAEENIWGFSANGTGCLPAHPRVPLALASTDTNTSTAATTLGTPTFTWSSAPLTTVAFDMSVGSSDTPTASSAAGVSTVAEYERDAYNYHMARTATSLAAPSQMPPVVSSTPTLTRSYHTMDAQPSSSRTEAKGDSDSCAESSSATGSSTSRLEVDSWNVSGTGTSSGTETPAALDTPAFRTPLGVYNGFVHGHRTDKEGYFPSSSSVSSVISAVSVQLREQFHEEAKTQVHIQRRPQLRHFPSLVQGVKLEEKSPKQALSLLALPAELVAHILRMGYFSPPRPTKSSSASNSSSMSGSTSTSTSSTIASSSVSDASHLSTSANSANGQVGTRSGNGEDNSFVSTNDDTQHEDEAEHEHEPEHEDYNPPTITCDPHLRLALLHTCRALRAAVFADPALWSVVRLGPGDGEGGIRRALGASPFPDFAASAEERGTKGRERTYLGHQLALARAHPLRISLTAFWGRSEVVEEREVDASEDVFAFLAGMRAPSKAPGVLDDARDDERTKQWEAFELVCPREDEWVVLARATAHRAFPKLRYLSLTFVGRSSGSAIPMPISTSVSTTRRRAGGVRREGTELRERRARDGRPGARHSVALPPGSFGGWRAGALPSLKGLLLRGVDLEGVVEDVLEHEYEHQDHPEHEVELDGDLPEDVFNSSNGAIDPPEPSLPSLRALDIRGHGLWPEVDTLDAFFTRHARGLRRLGVHVRSGDVLRDVVGMDADGSPLVSTSTSPLRIPNLRVLELDTSEGLNRDTARMVRLLAGSAVSKDDSGHSEMRKVVVKESGGVEGEELLRWSFSPRSRSLPRTETTAKPEARLAITNSAISSAVGALPPAMLRQVAVLVLDVPAGEGGWGEAHRLKEMLAIFGNEGDADDQSKSQTDGVVLGRLRRMEVRNADVLGVVREVLAQPQMSAPHPQAEHEEEGEHEDDDENEDGWERSLSSAGMAEPLCAAQELVISFSDAGSSGENPEDRLCKATAAFISLFGGACSSACLSSQYASSSLMAYPSTSASTYASLKKLILKGPTRALVTAVLRSLDLGNAESMAFDGPQIQVQDIRL